MSYCRGLYLVAFSVLVLGHSTNTRGQTTTQELCQPMSYAFANDSVSFNDSSCVRFSSDTEAPSGVNVSEYFTCSSTGRLIDLDLGPSPSLSPENNARVYTWEPGVAQLLFTFTSTKNFTSITFYYYRNITGLGVPKIRFCAVSEDSQIWNVSMSNDCTSQDAIRPGGDQACNEPPCKENITLDFNFNSRNVQLQIEDSKNYQFVVSEVQFSVSITGGNPGTTVATGTLSTTTTIGGETGEVNATDTTTLDGGVALRQLSGTVMVCVVIAMSLALLLFV